MSSLTPIRNALAAVIQVAVPTVTVSPFYRSQVNVPEIIVDVAPNVEEFVTLEGAVDFGARIMLLASAADDVSGQQVLDGWLASSGAGSVVAAIETNPHLIVQPPNGTGLAVCDYCVITRIGSAGSGSARGGYGIIDWAGVSYVGSSIALEIAASLP